MRTCATVLLMALALSGLAAGDDAVPAPNPQPVEVRFHPLPENRVVFYGMLGHSNGRIYVGLCYNVAKLAEFDPETGKFRIVARLTSEATDGGADGARPALHGDRPQGKFPHSDWKFAQDKIHTQLHEGNDGRIYGATHVRVEEPNRTVRYGGGHWFAYDPAADKLEDLGWARRHEGIITCDLDRKRNVLYGITWPTGYLVSCRPGEKTYHKRLHLLGLASSRLDCSSRYIGVTDNGRVYFPDGATGEVRIYDPKAKRIIQVDGLVTPPGNELVPREERNTLRKSGRWRNWWMTGTRSPDGMHLFFSPQRSGHLVEIDATRGEWGVVVDHGRTVPWGNRQKWAGPSCGAICFGPDGLLYHTVDEQVLTYNSTDGKVLDWGRAAIAGKDDSFVKLGGGGTLGRDGKIYFVTTHGRTRGLAVLDPAQFKKLEPRLLRVSPRKIIRPSDERGGSE
jgi:hypothetical protein